MAAEIGESLVGSYLRLIKGCEIVTFNQRLSKEPIQMGETDVLAIDLDTDTVYLCEVVTHIRGMRYGAGPKETLSRVRAKFKRLTEYGNRAFPTYTRVYMLWSPYVPIGRITSGLQRLVADLGRRGNTLELQINQDYAERVEELRDRARTDSKNYGEPFFRALQILERLRH